MKKAIAFTLLMALLLSGCAGTGSNDGITRITLNGDRASVSGGGAAANGSVVTISAVGTYSVSGKLSDGQIVIDTGEDAMAVTLILDNADITNLTDAAIYVRQAKAVRIQLASGSENRLCSGVETDNIVPDENASGAVIYSEDDLDIEGEGALSILGYINNGITCKDDLDINNGTITVLAANNGLRASESVEIKGGSLSINAGNDGIKSTSAKKEGKGYIAVTGGVVAIYSRGDGISAETELRIEDGIVAVYTTGLPDEISCKGLKAKTGLVISGGTVTVQSADHGVHSTAGIDITGGTLSIVSSDGKGIAAHGDLSISGGAVEMSARGRALESEGAITLAGCTVLALSNSEKAVAVTGQGLIQCLRSGAVGDAISILENGAEISGAVSTQGYKCIFFSSPKLTPGAEYSVSNGKSTVSVIAE